MKGGSSRFWVSVKVMFLVWLVLMLTPAGMLVALTPTETASAAKKTNGWASQYMDMFSQNDILYYNPDECVDGENVSNQTCVDGNCSAGLLPGNNNAEKIWNYFVSANIEGVSDNPAVIAGILGNFYIESAGTLDPFCHGYGGDCSAGNSDYYGLHAESNLDMKQAVDDAGYEQYWSRGDSAPATAVDEAIKIELDWMVKNNPRWVGGCTGAGCWSAEAAFEPNIDNVSDTGSPESYSDLFLVAVEGAYPGGNTAIEDSGVKAIADSMGWSSDRWQMATERRAAARDYYDQYAGTGATPSGSTSGFSETETLSGTANQKYTADDGEIDDLLEYSIWKAGQNNGDYKNVLSSILDDFEKENSEKKGDTDALMEYLKGQDDYEDFLDVMALGGITFEAGQEEMARSIVNKGLRTTSAGQAEITNGKNSNTTYCDGGSSKKGMGAAKIAETAALMAWPVQSWQTNANDYASDRPGKCYDGSAWVLYDGDGQCVLSPGNISPRQFYKEQKDGLNILGRYKDCGVFVDTVLTYLGLDDEGFPHGNYLRADWFSASSDWQEVENTGSVSNLKPGDVFTSPEHTGIFIGDEYGGEFGQFAHASGGGGEGTKVPRISNAYFNDGEGNPFRFWRYIGDKLGGGNCDQYEGGEAVACAAEYMAWTQEDKDKAYAGILTEEYKEAKDRWFGPNDGNSTGGDENDVSCARFASLSILESGVDPSFARSQSASRSNIRWVGGELEGYLASSPNWERVSGAPQRGDVIIDSEPHVWIYLGNGMIAEGAGLSGTNRAGLIMPEFNTAYGSYQIYRPRG